MSDHYETRTRFGWGGTIKNRAGGAVIGLILFGLAFPLLWWNESRLSRMSGSLDELARMVTIADTAQPNLPRDGKPMYFRDEIRVSSMLGDPDFGVRDVKALRLKRVAQMYQWQEEKSTRTEDRPGGGSERITSYDYRKIWTAGQIDSSHFQHADKYVNPGNPLSQQEWQAKDARIGFYHLEPVWISRLNDFVVYDPGAGWTPPPPYQRHGEWNYVAAHPDQPAIGDVRMRFEIVPAGVVSMIGVVQDNQIIPWTSSKGDTLLLIARGDVAAPVLIQHRAQEEQLYSWLFRLAGFIMMAIGIQGLFVLIGALGGIIPGFRMLAGFLGGLVGVIVALALSTLTISVAWFAARPMMALGMGGGALLLILVAGRLRRKSVQAPLEAPSAVLRQD